MKQSTINKIFITILGILTFTSVKLAQKVIKLDENAKRLSFQVGANDASIYLIVRKIEEFCK